MLPIIKNKIMPSIGEMHNIAMRVIFEPQNVPLIEMRVLEEGLSGWSRKIDLNRSEKWEIRRIISALEANELGHFNRSKALIKKHNVNYRLMYSSGLPFIADPYKARTFGKG